MNKQIERKVGEVFFDKGFGEKGRLIEVVNPACYEHKDCEECVYKKMCYEGAKERQEVIETAGVCRMTERNDFTSVEFVFKADSK